MLASTALCAAGLRRAALAADAIWVGQSSDYNNATHWLPTGPPDGTASFNTGSTSISVGTNGSVGQWLFDGSVAVPWTFSISTFPPFVFNGAGITIGPNAGTATLNLQPGAEVDFLNSSSAGTATINLTNDSFGNGSFLRFDGSSTAANATISLGGANANSFVAIEDTASGGSARFIVNGGGTLHISTLTSAGTTVGSIEPARPCR